MIEIIGTELYQWDTGRSVKVTGIEATHVHFANTGDSKAPIMQLNESIAKIPDYLLQTGKQLCVYAVANGVTIERKMFSVKKRERPENYVYDEDQRNFIYELIQSAEDATEGANKASEAATQAAQNAVESAEVADSSASRASEAAEDAEKASANANEAAAKASQTAKSLMVVGKAEGSSIYLDDAIDMPLVGLRVFGKTTQDGTPTLDAPVDLVSVGGSGSITVNVIGENDTQSMTIATPNGLPGIPVDSGGNYTDANGQQWICDEIDLARGVFVQRIFEYVCTGNERWAVSQNQFMNGATRYDCSTNAGYSGVGSPSVLCSHFPHHEPNELGAWANDKSGTTLQLRIQVENTVFASVDELVAFLKEQHDNGTPVSYLCILETPIETPLSAEEIAAYNNLLTYRDNTTVYNDAGAWMDLEYVMDAKKYIDSLIGSGGASARLASVTLRASAWTGADSLFSQVVTVAGVTPNSKVDLLPSVEQLAIFYNKDVTFLTENEGGVVTVYAIGEKPVQDYTMQVQITEVVV